MGDCRIRIQLSTSFVVTTGTNSLHNSGVADLITVATKIWSADATIDDVLVSTEVDVELATTSGRGTTAATTLLSLLDTGTVSIWDCTINPSVNITQLCNDRTVRQSKTLFVAGWYPSGSLQVLPIHATNSIRASSEAYDDVRFNSKNRSTNSMNASAANKVQILKSGETDNVESWIGDESMSTPMRPSEVLNAVATRFDNDNVENYQAALQIRQDNYIKKQQAIQRRHRKLDSHIRRLQTKDTATASTNANTNKGVSDQVRKMLIKSRATGRSNIQTQDRVYLHCVMWHDDDDDDDSDMSNSAEAANNNTRTKVAPSYDETYIYVSIQDTIGHVVDSFSNNKSQQQRSQFLATEMLVMFGTSDRHPHDNESGKEYRRLPSSLRFYEAMEQRLIEKDIINTVVIRFYDPSVHDETTSIVVNALQHVDQAMTLAPVVDAAAQNIEVNSTNDTITINGIAIPIPIVSGGVYCQLWDVVVKACSSGLTTLSATKARVRQMQIKSKARGDTKRIKQLENRFYFQLIAINHDRNTNTIQVVENIPIFVSRYDAVSRIVSDHPTPEKLLKDPTLMWDLLIPIAATTSTDDAANGGNFRLLASSDLTSSEERLYVDESVGKLTWDDFVQNGLIKCFDCVLILHHS